MPTRGRLTTHVLDVARGRPAAGIVIVLHALEDGAPRLLAEATTNADGRTDAPLLAQGELAAGVYELTFSVGAYLAPATFLGEIPVRFGVADPDEHHHVPLLLTPWSYSTYRGS